MQDREWLVPSVVLTVTSGVGALLFIPDYHGLLPALLILPAWLAAAAIVAAIWAFAAMSLRRVESPLGELRRLARSDRARMGWAALTVLLAGLNMIAFMWVKPLLNYLVPFRADGLLASIDHALFLGHEPFALLTWLNFPAAGLVYHQAWFVAMIVALLLAAWQRPSPEKSAVLLSYFLLWSVAGPLIHTLLPAAGPVFYDRMGYGARFAALDGGEETRIVADYLWGIYASRSFGAGSGISAMPSMHVTIAAWIVVAVRTFARRWTWLAGAAWALIFALSISLGWHYAVDGVVGTLAAAGTFRCTLALMRSRGSQIPRAKAIRSPNPQS